jgi:hypothetical protein
MPSPVLRARELRCKGHSLSPSKRIEEVGFYNACLVASRSDDLCHVSGGKRLLLLLSYLCSQAG